MVQNKEEMLAHIPAIQPVANKNLKRMASGYEYRIHPIYKTRKMHWGMDFRAKRHKFSQQEMEQLKKQNDQKRVWKPVRIDHGYGYETFVHLNKYTVKRNQKVKRGDIINRATGTLAPHLHYEVVKITKSKSVNYYFNDLTVKNMIKC